MVSYITIASGQATTTRRLKGTGPVELLLCLFTEVRPVNSPVKLERSQDSGMRAASHLIFVPSLVLASSVFWVIVLWKQPLNNWAITNLRATSITTASC